MSKNKRTAEKMFQPAFEEGTDEATLQGRVFENFRVAAYGPMAEEKYAKAHSVFAGCCTKIIIENGLEEITDESEIARVKKEREPYERRIIAFIVEAVKKKDGAHLRHLADIVEYRRAVSPDAMQLIFYCSKKPAGHIFTFKELLHEYATFKGLKLKYDEAVEQRVRRLIAKLGIRVSKGQ